MEGEGDAAAAEAAEEVAEEVELEEAVQEGGGEGESGEGVVRQRHQRCRAKQQLAGRLDGGGGAGGRGRHRFGIPRVREVGIETRRDETSLRACEEWEGRRLIRVRHVSRSAGLEMNDQWAPSRRKHVSE